MDKTTMVVLVILFVNIILIGICIYQISERKAECITNPLIYGAKLLSKANQGEFSCNCYIIPNEEKPASYSSPNIFFNSQGMEVEFEDAGSVGIDKINISLFEESLIVKDN